MSMRRGTVGTVPPLRHSVFRQETVVSSRLSGQSPPSFNVTPLLLRTSRPGMTWSWLGTAYRRGRCRLRTGPRPRGLTFLLRRARRLALKRFAFESSKEGWAKFVKEAADNSPSKLFKWVRGSTRVWDLAVRTPTGWASSPAEVADSELAAWSKLWKLGPSARQAGLAAGGHRFQPPPPGLRPRVLEGSGKSLAVSRRARLLVLTIGP
eukprot:1370311-Amphidinium_carterae.1